MSSLQYEALLRLFVARRLHPWVPEHALFISGELAKLGVTDPEAAASHRAFYTQKMDDYAKEHPDEIPVVVPAKGKESKESPTEPHPESVEETIVKHEKKKKKP